MHAFAHAQAPEQVVVPGEAVLLAAGLGKRLKPFTDTRPKPLIEVGGQTMLARVVENASAEGVQNFVVNTHYLSDQIAAAVAGYGVQNPHLRFSLSHEADGLLDTGGGARRAFEGLSGARAFVFNTDAFWLAGTDRPLSRMAQKAAGEPNIVLLCAHPGRSVGFRRSHDFCLDPMGTVTLDRGLPVIFAGVTLLDRSAFATAPDGPFSILDLFEKARAHGQLKGVLLNTEWMHVGDPEALSEANRFVSAQSATRNR